MIDEEILCICVGMSLSHHLGAGGGGAGDGGGGGSGGGGGGGGAMAENKVGKGSAYFTGGNDKLIRVWALLDFTCVATLEGHTDAVNHMVVDANFLFSGSEDRTIRLWNVADIHDPYQLTVINHAHTESVRSILVIPDLGYIASCAFDGLIRIWDYNHDDDDDDDDDDGDGWTRCARVSKCVSVCVSERKGGRGAREGRERSIVRCRLRCLSGGLGGRRDLELVHREAHYYIYTPPHLSAPPTLRGNSNVQGLYTPRHPPPSAPTPRPHVPPPTAPHMFTYHRWQTAGARRCRRGGCYTRNPCSRRRSPRR